MLAAKKNQCPTNGEPVYLNKVGKEIDRQIDQETDRQIETDRRIETDRLTD